MTSKQDMLYDDIMASINRIYSDELDNPLCKEIIMAYTLDYLKNMDDDNLKDELASVDQDPKREVLDQIEADGIKELKNFSKNGWNF